MTRRNIPVAIFIACGGWLIGLGLYFMLFRPALLPEDPRYIGRSLGEIRSALPGLGRWLSHVAGTATVVTMSWTNFAIDSDFKWPLLAPAVLWLAGIAVYLAD